jgi:hypothetical protein
MLCDICGQEKNWQALSSGEARYLGVPGLSGYWYCHCVARDMRPASDRYPADFYTATNSNAAVVGLSADALRRLYRKDPSLGFMIKEGSQLISHPSSMEAWGSAYEVRKQEARRDEAKDGDQRGFLLIWTR